MLAQKAAIALLAVLLMGIYLIVSQKSQETLHVPMSLHSTFETNWKNQLKDFNSSTTPVFVDTYNFLEVNSSTKDSIWYIPKTTSANLVDVHEYRLNSGESAYCNCSEVAVYTNPYADDSDIMCIKMKVKPQTVVCVYDPAVDVYISRELLKDGIWEPHILSKFLYVLQKLGPEVGVLDLGANIGVYSLIAASLGHHVISVEPSPDNMKRIYKAGKISGVLENITLLQIGISDKCSKGYIVRSKDNQGDTRVEISTSKHSGFSALNSSGSVNITTLNCILRYLKTSTIIIKVDIQGYEHRAFVDSIKVFDSVYVPYIFMEWSMIREYYDKDRKERKVVAKMLSFMFHRGYKPHSLLRQKVFLEEYWYGWPDDVLWIHADVNKKYKM